MVDTKLIRMWLAGATLAGAGCDWRQLDKAVADAPVLSVRSPDGYKGGDFGRVMLPLPAPKGTAIAARYLVAATNGGGALAVVDMDAAGAVTTHVAPVAALAEFIDFKNPVKSAALLEDGRILLGLPNVGVTELKPPRGRVVYLSLTQNGTGVEFTLQKGSEPADESKVRYGLAVATGKISGGDADDYVVAAENDVALVEDGMGIRPIYTDPKCEMVALPDNTILGKPEGFRALVTGDFLEGGGDEIAVGVPREVQPGRVVVLTKIGMGATAALACDVEFMAPSDAGDVARFGASLAAADLDGDGKKESLLVGSPPERAYLYKGPFKAGAMVKPTLVLNLPGSSPGGATGEFGQRVAFADIDGKPGQEILVSASQLAVNQKRFAGQVHVFAADDGRPLTKVNDNSPEADTLFGFSVGELKFMAPACPSGAAAKEQRLLLVGSKSEVFTYFRLPGVPVVDPRCFALKK